MADRSMDFTGNNDWPSIGKALDPANHPATSMPTATQHYDGNVLKDSMSGRSDYTIEKDKTQAASDYFRNQ